MGEDALAGLERLGGVLPAGEDLVQKFLGLGDEVAAGEVLCHAEVLGGAAEGDDVEGVELDPDVVAELGDQLEGLGASGDVVELEDAGVVLAFAGAAGELADCFSEEAAPIEQWELQ